MYMIVYTYTYSIYIECMYENMNICLYIRYILNYMHIFYDFMLYIRIILIYSTKIHMYANIQRGYVFMYWRYPS